MGTEVAISFSALRAQLENERSSLFKIDENIKKIVQTTGRVNDRFNTSGEYPRSGSRLVGRNSFPDAGGFNKNEDQYGKRKHETKTVFSRLSARVNDSDGEDDGPGVKRARVPSAVCRELPTRAAVLRAQGDDEQARTRNRRIFGSLLGTLQKFKQEEIVLQTKEEKKAQVERKIEEQARLEKEREQKERKTLFAEREHKKATIKALEAKMARVQEFEKWEELQKPLGNFILTKAKPHVYWLPKKMTEKATEKLMSSRKYQEKCVSRARASLQEELRRIETRVRAPHAPALHAPALHAPAQHAPAPPHEEEARTGHRRDKFSNDADADTRDDSDADDTHHAEAESNNDSKMDTSIENNTNTEMDVDNGVKDSTATDNVQSLADSRHPSGEDSNHPTAENNIHPTDDSSHPNKEDSDHPTKDSVHPTKDSVQPTEDSQMDSVPA